MKNSKQANSRRQFLGKVGGITAGAVAVNVMGLSALGVLTETTAKAEGISAPAAKLGGDELQMALYQHIGQLKAELELVKEKAAGGVFYR